MESTAESYRSAALEHLERAQTLHTEGHYYLAHYVAGLAVECMLRARRRKFSAEFDARHDLYDLARSARFFDLIPHALHEEYGAKFALLNLRWRSNHRYLSEAQWRAYLTTIKADFNVVNLGDRKWNDE